MTPYLPAEQGVHAELHDAPIVDEYVPIGQRVHVPFVDAPLDEEYVPAGQGVGLMEESGQ